MQTVQLVFVGIFMFFVEVALSPIGITSSVNSVKPCAILNDGNSFNKQLLNIYNTRPSSFRPIQASKSDLHRRNRLTASVQKKLSPTFSPTNWNEISQLKGKSDLATVSNFNDDNLNEFSIQLKNIYYDILLLLLLKIQSWLKNNEGLDTIEHYLGYDLMTVDLINISMTELLTEKRNSKNGKINNLESLFYYSCDIKHMHENKDTVKKKLNDFISLFQFTEKEILKYKEDELREDLIQNLQQIADKTSTSFSISIESMKMRIILDSSDNKIVNPIKKRIVNPSTNETVLNLVESYATESNGVKVDAYHVSILSILIPDIFGHVYNHYELLSKLKDHNIDANDEITIKEFAPFMRLFLSIFVNRFFEFKRMYSQEFIDAMLLVMNFLDPPKLTDDQLSTTRELDYNMLFEQKKSILNYFNKTERNDVVDYMKIIMEDAVKKILETCNGELPDYWKSNRWSKIVYKEETPSKENLIELVRSNNCEAFDIIHMFRCELTLDNELYNKYNLNHTIPFDMSNIS